MTDKEPTTASRRKRGLAGAVGLLLAGALGGGAIAATTSASASGTSSAATSSTSQAAAGRSPGAPAHTATSVRPGEKAVTGANLATLKAAALKAVPGGTVYRVETDADGAMYEAHMTREDGTEVTVKFDRSLKVTAVQQGRGAGGPGRSGGAPGSGPSGGPAGGPAASNGGGA